MKKHLFVVLVILCAATSTRGAETAEEALDALQGTWSIVSFTADGNEIPAATLVTWQRTVKVNHVVWKQGDETLVETDIQVDPSKKPMTLDSTIASGDQKGQTMLAIYELSGDELRVCFAKPGLP